MGNTWEVWIFNYESQKDEQIYAGEDRNGAMRTAEIASQEGVKYIKILWRPQ